MYGSTLPRGLKALTKAGSDRTGSTPVTLSLTFLHLEKLQELIYIIRSDPGFVGACAWRPFTIFVVYVRTETLFFFLARGTQRQFAPTYIENTFFIIIVMIIVIRQ